MGSKAFVFLGLFLAVALLISSEVLAKDLAETATSTTPTTADQQTNGIDDAKFRGRRGDTRPGRGFRGGRYGGGGGGGYRGGGGGYGRSGYNEEGN